MDDSVDLSGVCVQHDNVPSCTKAPPTSDKTSTRQFDQVLQQRHVPNGACTDLLDQEGPPSEAMERREGNDLNDEGSEGQNFSKTDATSTIVESDEQNSSRRAKRECVHDSM